MNKPANRQVVNGQQRYVCAKRARKLRKRGVRVNPVGPFNRLKPSGDAMLFGWVR